MKINIVEYLEETLKVASDKIAIIDKDRQISFGELSKKSKKIATHLIQKRIIKSPIAVFLPKSIESILSNIAITYSGNIYMNLDIKNPIERIKNIILLIKPNLIITF